MEKTALKSQRNYQLDVYKLLFSLFIMFYHFLSNCTDKSTYDLPFDFSLSGIGHISVHVFFVISGLLMVNSLTKRSLPEPADCGEASLKFVLNKYKAILLPYSVTLAMQLIVYFWWKGSEAAVERLPMLIPEFFLLFQGGTNIYMIQLRSWYISAMLIAMLPLSYMLMRNKNFYIRVFAPLTAILATGYMYASEFSSRGHLLSNTAWCGLVTGGVIRALSGICMGAVAWLISQKLSETVVKKKHRVMVTIAEILVLLIFFKIFSITDKNANYTYVVFTMIPLVIGIAFSQASYISSLFKSKIFSKFGSLSLAVYFLHWIGERVVVMYFGDEGNKVKLLISAAVTAAACVIYYLVQYLLKLLWNKKLKALLS